MSAWLDRALAFGLLAALLVALCAGIGPNASTRIVGLGEQIWPGYGADLRHDPTPPECDPDALTARLATCVDAPAAAPEGDPFADDPFAEPPPPAPEPDPFADPPAPEPDPFADPPPADPFAEPDPFADPPAGAAPTGESCAALTALADRCTARWARHADIVERITPGVLAWRALDRPVAAIAAFPYKEHLLVLVFLLGGLAATAHRTHLALRDPETLREHRISQGAQLAANLVWMVSCLADWRVQALSSAEQQGEGLAPLWALGFALSAAMNVRHLAAPPALTGPGSPVRQVLVVPLYVWMVGVSAVWYWALQGHPSGPAILLAKLTSVHAVYLGIGLYIWAGMLLARTTLAARVFDVLTPWKLPPALLAWVVVVLSALPTAYSGASGIFVIAAGAVIFERLRAEGAPPRLALAATAMSGSLGVVLRPCLVVVLVSILNPNVTTDQLFSWGRWVFALTAGLFLVAMLLRNDQPLRVPPVRAALTGSGRAIGALLPYAAVAALGLLVYWLPLGTPLDEQTGPFVVPGVMLALAAWDRCRARDAKHPERIGPALVGATSTSAHHVGALLFVMAASVGFGVVVERAELLELLPANLGSRGVAMLFLVVVMVLVGMTMDALGAVVLVSATLAHVAEANGIHPVHFWMMVLCAFELGYLTPPVALNHLLARQVIGVDAEVERLPGGTWAQRHEHLLIPMAVMGTALVLVAFVPLGFV